MSEDKWNKNQDSLLECFNRGSDRIKEAGKPSPPKEHSEKIEFLSRQHIDFRTTEGMKQLIQAVTWRVKIIAGIDQIYIFVRKKKIPEIRRLAKKFGLATVHYEIKELRWHECWFKRFKHIELVLENKSKIYGVPFSKWIECGIDFSCQNRIIHIDPASKDGDYSARATFEKKKDGSIELVDMELIKPKHKPIPKFISKGQGKTPTGETLYFLKDPDGLLEVGKTIILNGKAVKVKKIVRKKGNQLTGIVTKFI